MSGFDDALHLEPQPDGRWRGHTHPAYANMVGPYGGITAAQALQAVLQQPGCLGDPLALTVNYAAALSDGAFTVQARAVRTNRSTQHWTVELSQGELVTTSATVVTAVRREAFVDAEHAMPAVPAPDRVPRVATAGMVAWLDRYEMRPLEGVLPAEWDGREHPDSLSRLWVRDDPPRPLDAPALAALCDVFYPRIWRRRAQWTPAGTVSMTVYFHAERAALQATGTGYLLAQARAQAFAGGFFDQTAQLWNEAGALLATSHQIVYHK